MAVALAEQQCKVVAAPGDFLLLACPGSGKTRTAAARIARLDEEGHRIAACSYTNVGADRIATMLARDHRRFFGPRSFTGTLHGFLLRYVVYPFAHLIGAEKAPRLWLGEWPDFGYSADPRLRLSLDQFRIAPDGALIFSGPPQWAIHKVDEVLAAERQKVINGKRGLFQKQGVLSADDAMWAALRILKAVPAATEGLAGRFDEILIDEAQDTSDVQLACLRKIHASGRLKSLVMVGDLEQSIFAYQGASAKACRELAENSGLQTISLSENHRSSQKLCDVAGHFCGRGADQAVGPNRNCQIDPELFLYPPDQPTIAMEHFRERLTVHGIERSEASVLARSHKMIARLGGHEELVKVGPTAEALGKLSAALAGGTLGRWDVARAEGLIAHGAFDKHPTALEFEVREPLRDAAHRLISDLPPLEGDLRSWVIAARPVYGAALAHLCEEPRHKPGPMLKAPEKYAGFEVADIFSPPPLDLTPRTVHSLKGEEREAVMVVVKKHHGADRAKQMQFLEVSLAGEDIAEEEEEERRINYVALTRAERFCLLALPDDSRGRALAQKCESIGFASVLPQM
jgi:DNA helicase II / ATP-dependent DNA helicase PcrA